MAAREELEAMLVAAPEDDPGYLIYADWLLAHGDPRGELIALDAAIPRAPAAAERASLRRRRAELFVRHPELVPPMVREVSYRWHLGFVREVGFDVPDDVTALFAHPSLAFASALRVGQTWSSDNTPADLSTLDAIRAPIRALSLGESGRWSYQWGDVDLDPTLAALPRLERLRAYFPLRFTHLPRVRELHLRTGTSAMFDVLARADMSALERLAVQLRPWMRDEQAPALANVAPLLAAPPPRLAHLELVDIPFGDALIELVATSPLLRQLRTLRLWNAGLTLAGARHVTRERFGHLELLDLSDPSLDDNTAAQLAHACDDVIAIPPRFSR